MRSEGRGDRREREEGRRVERERSGEGKSGTKKLSYRVPVVK